MRDGKLGIALIGAGRAGLIHAKNFINRVPAARLLAISDPFPEARENALKELGDVKAYDDYEGVLEDKEIDAAVVVTPTSLHREIVASCAEAGKHIFCEKPMAMNEGECRAMIAAADKAGVKLQVGFMRRFDSGFRRAKEIVKSGAIGNVVMVRSNTRGPSRPKPWMYDIKKSNGPLAEVNSHDIDTVRWFAESNFKTVYAIAGNYRCPDAREDFPDFYDNVILTGNFENGKQGLIDGAQGVGYAYDARVEILGERGCVFIGSVNGDAVLTCASPDFSGTKPLVESWRNLFEPAYLAEDIAFVSAIQNDSEPEVTGADGLEAVKVVNAGNISIAEKRIVEL